MRIATIDIGTNCVSLLVAETDGAALRPVLERATITRLGEGVDRNRYLLPEACERTLACLSDYGRTLRELGVAHLDAVGTSAMRDAAGGEQFLARAAEALGVAPRVIGGNEEARLTFAGALSGLPVTGKVTVFDIGGGSTEIVVGKSGPNGRSVASAVSLDVGSVRLFERYLRSDPPTLAELQNIEQDIAAALRGAPKPERDATLVGVAGTVTQLAALHLELAQYDAARVHGSKLSLSTIDRLAAQLASQSVAGRRALRGMAPARADVIVVGSAIARAVLHWSDAEEVIVSDRGVRWGLAEELAARSRAGA